MTDIELQNKIKFVGLNELDEEDQQKIKDTFYEEYPRIERELKNIRSVKLHIKRYEKQGAPAKKYSVDLLIDAPTGIIEAHHTPESVEHDIIASVHSIIDSAIREINHKLKNDTSWDKEYTKGKL